jgi:DNA-binding CsgD family transcriptional regulator
MDRWPTTGAILGAAFDATSRDDLRMHILSLLARAIGADAGFFANFTSPILPKHTLHWPTEVLEFARRQLPVAKGTALRPLTVAMHRDGAAVETEVYSRKELQNNWFFRDTLAPLKCSSHASIEVLLPGSGGDGALIVMGRSGGRAFAQSVVPRLARLRHAIGLADAALRPSQPFGVPRFPAGLTERKREICEYAALGYTNAEIARACGISVHTVRNHLALLFTEFDVLTRTELIARLTDLARNSHSS